MLKDFKAFIMRGNVVDMAVGIIIGAAFSPIIASLVKDVIMPPIGFLFGKVDFANLYIVLRQGNVPGPYDSLSTAQIAGAVTINYGNFINTIITFLIIAVVVFFLVVRPIAKMNERQKARETAVAPPAPLATKECPFCYTQIPIKANRCPNCTSELTK
jgi:large conductance mechanosensitive channel